MGVKPFSIFLAACWGSHSRCMRLSSPHVVGVLSVIVVRIVNVFLKIIAREKNINVGIFYLLTDLFRVIF